MSELQDLENKSLYIIYIIREAYAEFKEPAVLRSMVGDSYRHGL
jgi:hypothetical protein